MAINMNEKKGQAGLDFLMTYGWALLLIVIVIGALFALGVFNVGSFVGTRASGFAEVAPIGWQISSSGVLTMKFRNDAGVNINVTSINATLGTQTISYTTPFTISNGEKSSTITVGTFSNPGSSGSSYSVKVKINYKNMDTGFEAIDSGTVTGSVV